MLVLYHTSTSIAFQKPPDEQQDHMANQPAAVFAIWKSLSALCMVAAHLVPSSQYRESHHNTFTPGERAHADRKWLIQSGLPLCSSFKNKNKNKNKNTHKHKHKHKHKQTNKQTNKQTQLSYEHVGFGTWYYQSPMAHVPFCFFL